MILIVWIYAAEDKPKNGPPRGWFKETRDIEGYNCYGLLLGFGIILGSTWIASGIFGIIVSQRLNEHAKLVFLKMLLKCVTIFSTSILLAQFISLLLLLLAS